MSPRSRNRAAVCVPGLVPLSDTIGPRSRARAQCPARDRAAHRAPLRSSAADRAPARACMNARRSATRRATTRGLRRGSGAFRTCRHSLRCCRRSNGAVLSKIVRHCDGRGTVKDEPDTLPDAERASRTETPSTPERNGMLWPAPSRRVMERPREARRLSRAGCHSPPPSNQPTGRREIRRRHRLTSLSALKLALASPWNIWVYSKVVDPQC